MMFLFTALFVVTATASAIPQPAEKIGLFTHRAPVPAARDAPIGVPRVFALKRRTNTTDPSISTYLSATPTPSFSTATSAVPTPSITTAPTLEQVTGALAVADGATSECKPSSVCLRAFSCKKMYGGCYDANFCDGNTSPYPIPTCAPAGLPTSTPTSSSAGPASTQL